MLEVFLDHSIEETTSYDYKLNLAQSKITLDDVVFEE